MNSEKSSERSHAGVRYSHLLVQISFYGLLLSFTSRIGLQILAGGNLTALVVVWLVQTMPLAIFIPGLLRRHLRTHAWLCFVSLLYFIAAVMTAFTPGSLLYGLLLCLLCSGLFTALVAYINLARRHLGGTLQS